MKRIVQLTLALALFPAASSVSARFVSVDPVQPDPTTGDNFNRYHYGNNNPYKYKDPDGRETIVIVNNNMPIIGTHSGLMISRDGNNLLYDPAGSYKGQTRGTGGTFDGPDANLADYVQFQKADGPEVLVFRFDTTPQQEAEIAANVEEIGDPRGWSCTTSVSGALNGVGEFKDLGIIRTPSGLENAMVEMKAEQAIENEKKALDSAR